MALFGCYAHLPCSVARGRCSLCDAIAAFGYGRRLQLVEDTAKQMDIPLSIVQKKINISNDVVSHKTTSSPTTTLVRHNIRPRLDVDGFAVGHILPGPHRCTQVAWEHEQFSRKRILAATLSSRPSSAHVSSGLFDARSRVSTPILRRNIGLVIELLAKHIYGHRQLALKYVGRIRPLLCRSTVAQIFPAMRTASVCG
jgi:hypothetical protein